MSSLQCHMTLKPDIASPSPCLTNAVAGVTPLRRNLIHDASVVPASTCLPAPALHDAWHAQHRLVLILRLSALRSAHPAAPSLLPLHALFMHRHTPMGFQEAQGSAHNMLLA